jgi:hypothetical protein
MALAAVVLVAALPLLAPLSASQPPRKDSAPSPVAQANRAASSADRRTFCGVDLSRRTGPLDAHLQPRDEAARRPDFLAFRTELQAAVARRDEEAVLRIVDPGVRIDFGDGGGIEGFTRLMRDPDEKFWDEFVWVLAHGGTFRTPTDFDAPYTFSAWPDELDVFECLAVTGNRVRLRDAPSAMARVLDHLDFAIVERVVEDRETPGWAHVRFASGEAGYIASTYIRSPIGYRAIFNFKDGRWRLTAFIAGD